MHRESPLLVISVANERLAEGLEQLAQRRDASRAILMVVDGSPLLTRAIATLVHEHCGAPPVIVDSARHLTIGSVYLAVGGVHLDPAAGVVSPCADPRCNTLLETLQAFPRIRAVILDRVAPERAPAHTDVFERIGDAPLLLAELDHHLRIVRLNARFPHHEAAIGRSLIDGYPAFAELLPMLHRARRGEIVNAPRSQLLGRHFDLHFRPLVRPGAPDGVLLIGLEVTKWEVLRRELQLLADILEAVPLGILLLRRLESGDFKIERAFAEFRAHFPLRPGDAIGRPLSALFPGWEQTQVPATLERVLKEGRSARLEQIVQFEGQPQWHLLRGLVSRMTDDLVVATLEDVSDLRRARRRRVRAERLDALGRLAGGVAHSLNSLLAAILGHARALPTHDDPALVARSISTAAERAANLVAQLLTVSRRRPVAPRPVDVCQLMQRDEPTLRTLLGGEAPLRVRLPHEPAVIAIDPSALQQALISLIDNARDAIRPGDQVIVEVAFTGSPEAPEVCISVEDEGVGMTPSVRARCFEPYFSRRPDGGAGLGLPTVLGIVEQAGGRVALRSAPDRGTRVSLYFPRLSGAADPLGPPSPDAARAGERPCRLLVVEDESLLRRVLEQHLAHVGFKVESVCDGHAALQRLERPPAIDCLLTDVVMPGMNGLALIEAARARQPGLPAVVMTGYTDHALLDAYRWAADTPRLNKPFDFDELVATLRAATTCRDDDAS